MQVSVVSYQRTYSRHRILKMVFKTLNYSCQARQGDGSPLLNDKQEKATLELYDVCFPSQIACTVSILLLAEV